MSYDYDHYIHEHVALVNDGLIWIADKLDLEGIGFSQNDISNALNEAINHDQSKCGTGEYPQYDAYFYGGNRSHKVVMDFKYAWLHHQHCNPHHWQYWVLINDDPKENILVLEMPKNYILEMVADWWTFSWRNENLYEIFDWYDEHKDYMLLHKNTRKLVEDLLHAIYEKLEEQDELKHSELTDEELEKRKYAFPEERKFPLPDKAHVKSAIRFFNYVNPKKEKQLADAILKRMSELDMSFWTDITVGDENRFKNYLPKEEEHLAHHGIMGQKWGIRRYQNPDGTRTALGKARYNNHTVFVSGSSKTQTEDSGYYRKELPKDIKSELDHHMRAGNKVIVGDAPGIDRQVQDYLNEKDYGNVEVYGPGKQVRYSANKNWKTNPIDDPEHEEGSKEWLAKKDKAMADAADEGLAVILDEGAAATRKNVGRLADQGKEVYVYQLDKKGLDLDRWFDEGELLDLMTTEVDKLYEDKTK